MPSNPFENYIVEISTLRSIIKCQNQCHIRPDSKVRSYCHLVVKVRHCPKSARGLNAIGKSNSRIKLGLPKKSLIGQAITYFN